MCLVGMAPAAAFGRPRFLSIKKEEELPMKQSCLVVFYDDKAKSKKKWNILLSQCHYLKRFNQSTLSVPSR